MAHSAAKEAGALPLPARHERGEGWGKGLVPSNCRSLLKSPLPTAPSGYVLSVAAGSLPAVEPGILPGGKGEWFEKTLPLRTSSPGGKMPPSTAAKMAGATAREPHAQRIQAGGMKYPVAQTFLSAGSAGFPARRADGRLESRPNQQA